jgi:IclR family acetate operon transcriptional repressor
VQSVERALMILEVLGATPRGLTLSEIARTISLSKSATLALLRTLAERDFVAQSNAGRGPRYRLGLSLARLGDEVLTQGGLLEPAIPVLERLTRATGRTSRVGVLDNGYVVIIGRVDGPGFIQVQSHVGRREFAHCSALGKALLSRLPDEEIVQIVNRIGLPSRTQTTITGLDALLEDIRRARETGFALDDEEDNVGVFCIGAPVFDYRDACVAAISITDIKIASNGVSIADLAASVLQHAKELSAVLGAPVTSPAL